MIISRQHHAVFQCVQIIYIRPLGYERVYPPLYKVAYTLSYPRGRCVNKPETTDIYKLNEIKTYLLWSFANKMYWNPSSKLIVMKIYILLSIVSKYFAQTNRIFYQSLLCPMPAMATLNSTSFLKVYRLGSSGQGVNGMPAFFSVCSLTGYKGINNSYRVFINCLWLFIYHE